MCGFLVSCLLFVLCLYVFVNLFIEPVGNILIKLVQLWRRLRDTFLARNPQA